MDKTIETKSCRQCSSHFNITLNDVEFYDKISPIFQGKKYQIPTPTLCPECREQRRLCFKNELKLYKSMCDGCGTSIISRFYEGNKFKNYCNKCWSSDSWDALSYGKEVNFSRSFFDQIGELQTKVPFQNLIGSFSNIENNAVYTNNTADISNSYMVSESDFVQECYYGRLLRKSENLFDCLECSNSHYCYECINGNSLYNCFYATDSTGCRDCSYIENCHNCTDCWGCTNLENKQYCIQNIQFSKQEYFCTLEKLRKDSEKRNTFLKEVKRMFSRESKKRDFIIGSEGSSGNNIMNSKNCINCHGVIECEDCKYCSDINYSQDLMDISSYGSNSFLMYEGLGVGRYSHNILFSSTVGKGENLLYCIETKKSKNCFGCVNLKGAEYCILNKKYNKDEYEELVPRIIEHMKKLGEWGEFFPQNLSVFGYNETVAQEYFPLTASEIEEKGWNWCTFQSALSKVDKTLSAKSIPENIDNIPDDILNWAIECEITKKPFRIIPQELEFYRKYSLSIPKKHPDQRRVERMQRKSNISFES